MSRIRYYDRTGTQVSALMLTSSCINLFGQLTHKFLVREICTKRSIIGRSSRALFDYSLLSMYMFSMRHPHLAQGASGVDFGCPIETNYGHNSFLL